jgi:hypothetical protein
MTFDELAGRYARLRRELAEAYAAPDWSGALIDRLAAEIVSVERALGSLHRRRDQANVTRHPVAASTATHRVRA